MFFFDNKSIIENSFILRIPRSFCNNVRISFSFKDIVTVSTFCPNTFLISNSEDTLNSKVLNLDKNNINTLSLNQKYRISTGNQNDYDILKIILIKFACLQRVNICRCMELDLADNCVFVSPLKRRSLPPSFPTTTELVNTAEGKIVKVMMKNKFSCHN